MTPAVVLGNGISRQHVPFAQLQAHGTTYGCNALYREHTPDVLVATDRPIATHIQQSGYSLKHVFYTRRPLPGLGANLVPKPYFGYSSGPIAVALAAQAGHDVIYLVGFDMGGTARNTINNVYAGTEFYKATTAAPTYTGNWLKQLMRVMTDHKNTQFVRVSGAMTAPVPELNTMTNLRTVDLSLFLARINTLKDN